MTERMKNKTARFLTGAIVSVILLLISLTLAMAIRAESLEQLFSVISNSYDLIAPLIISIIANGYFAQWRTEEDNLEDKKTEPKGKEKKQ